MKREEKGCVMIGMGAVLLALSIVYWYISIPALCIYFYLRHRKKKKNKYLPPITTKSPYPPPRMKYRKTLDYVSTEREMEYKKKIRAKAQYKPRTCEMCGSVVKNLSTNCPYCGSSL